MSFDVQMICICSIVFELYERERKERKKNKIKIFRFSFLDIEKAKWDSASVFYNRIAKGFYYLGAASIPYLQDAIPYSR